MTNRNPEDLLSTVTTKIWQIRSASNGNDSRITQLDCNSTGKPTEAKNVKCQHLFGIILSALAGLAFAMANIVSRKLPYIASTQLTMQCCGGMILSNLPIVIYKRVPPAYTTKINFYLFLRACVTTIAFNCIYLALTFITVADMSVIGSCSPIITTIFARVGLKESCGVIHVVCLILSFIGILLVSKVPLLLVARTVQYDVSYLWGILIAISGTVCFALCNVFPRVPCMMPIHYSISVFYIGIVAVIGSGIVTHLAFQFSLPQCGVDRLYIILHTIIGSSIESLVTAALRYEQASIVIMVLSTTNIVITFVWQTLIDGITPDEYTSSGALIVIVCIFLICARDKINAFFSKLRK